MFTVHGYIDGVYYAVTVGEPRPDAAASVGVVSGSSRACLLLRLHEGSTLPESGIIVDTNDPASVLATLSELTQVTRTEGVQGGG